MRIDSNGIDVTGVTKTSGSGYNPNTTGWATNAALITTGSYGGGLTFVDGSAGYSIRAENSGADLVIGQGATSGALTTKVTINSAGLDVTGSTITTGTSGTTQWQAGSSANKLTIASYDNNIFYHKLSSGNSTSYQVGVEDNIPIYTITNNTVRTTLLGNGNFGVGTTAPKTKTQITSGGTLNAPSLGSSSSNAPLYLTNNDTNYGLVVGNSSADGHVWLQAQRTDGTATAYNMTLNEAGGNVGIGTSAPTAKLSVAGDLTVSSTIEVGSLTPNQDGAIEVGVIALGTPAISSTTDSTSLRNHIIFDNPNGASW